MPEKASINVFTFKSNEYKPKTSLVDSVNKDIFVFGNDDVQKIQKDSTGEQQRKDSLTQKEVKIRQLKEEFQSIINEQGIFGKSYCGIKNIFKTEYSSLNIEKELNKLSHLSTDKEIEHVEKMIQSFMSRQNVAVDTAITTGSTITVGALGAKVGGLVGTAIGSIVPGVGNLAGGVAGTVLCFAGGAIVGAVSNVLLNQVENMTDSVDNNAWHNDKNIGEEVVSGAIVGTIMMISGGISKKISGICKHALGLTKQGVVLTGNGAANVAKTVAYTAIAEGVGGAVSSTAITDGKYIIQCAADENKEFSKDEFIQATLISSISGGVINAGFGSYQGYSNAIKYNNSLSDVSAESFKSTARTSDETSEIKSGKMKATKKFVKNNVKSIVKKNIKSDFKKGLSNIFKINKSAQVKPQAGPKPIVKAQIKPKINVKVTSPVKPQQTGLIYSSKKNKKGNN